MPNKKKHEILVPDGTILVEKPLIKRELPEGFKPEHKHLRTLSYTKRFPAGRGKTGKIKVEITQSRPKKHSKGISLLKLFPITFQLYINPKQNILLCSAKQWHNLTKGDIDELLATILYIKGLILHKKMVFLTQNGSKKRVRVDVKPHVVEIMKKIDKKVKKFNKKRKVIK